MRLVYITLFCIAFITISCGSQSQKADKAGYVDLYSKEFKQKLDNEKGIILDVRTAEEFSEGHIPNAINIDFYQDDIFASELGKLDKQKSVFVYCRSGGRSQKSAEILSTLGFEKVYNLADGITDWKENGFEVVK